MGLKNIKTSSYRSIGNTLNYKYTKIIYKYQSTGNTLKNFTLLPSEEKCIIVYGAKYFSLFP